MATTAAVPPEVLTDLVRERARAEAREVVGMLDYRDAELERIAESGEAPMTRRMAGRSVALAIGEASGMSEGQVHYQLTRAESVHRLDRRVVGYAETHTVAELRTWLKAFVRRVEADLAVERAEDERAKRHVSVTHGDDSMGWLNAYLPSHELAAVEDRYRKAGRRITDPDDERTLAQREADLLVAWCTESDAASSAIDANIAVTVGSDVLGGRARVHGVGRRTLGHPGRRPHHGRHSRAPLPKTPRLQGSRPAALDHQTSAGAPGSMITSHGVGSDRASCRTPR